MRIANAARTTDTRSLPTSRPEDPTGIEVRQLLSKSCCRLLHSGQKTTATWRQRLPSERTLLAPVVSRKRSRIVKEGWGILVRAALAIRIGARPRTAAPSLQANSPAKVGGCPNPPPRPEVKREPQPPAGSRAASPG